MKVLCIYNHAEYCRPLVRSVGAFRGFGIDLEMVKVPCAGKFLAMTQRPFDVLLLQEPPVTEAMISTGKPTILLERVDGAQLRASRQFLPRVAGVIKSYAFRDRSQYNREHDRAHIRLLHEAGIKPEGALHRDELPQPQLSDDELAKIHVGYSGFGCYDTIGVALDVCVDVELEGDRPVDVHFAGMVNYLNPEGLPTEVDLHRKAALKVAEDWPGKSIASPGRQIPRLEYYDQMRQSKVVISPWGWGEATYRDYEAMALGAVVLKPDSRYMEAWPDIYCPASEWYYKPCLPDFSDAVARIQEVLDYPADYRRVREAARNAVKAAWQPRAIAERMSTLIKEIVG